jgi:hypothetical protein
METSSSNRSELTVGGRRKRGRRRCRCCTCAQGSGHRGMGALQQPWELNFPRCGRAVSMQCNATGRGDVDPGDPCYAMPIASASLRATHAYRPPKAQCVSEQWWSLSQATTTTATGWISVQAPPGDSEPGTSTTTRRESAFHGNGSPGHSGYQTSVNVNGAAYKRNGPVWFTTSVATLCLTFLPKVSYSIRTTNLSQSVTHLATNQTSLVVHRPSSIHNQK